MQVGHGWRVETVSDGRAQVPHTLWFTSIGPWRCLCERRREEFSHMRGFWEVLERGGHGQIVAARPYRWYCCVTVGRGLASEI